MTTLMHDPVPDGKSGPFMRKPHAKLTPEGAGYAYDERCDACVTERLLRADVTPEELAEADMVNT